MPSHQQVKKQTRYRLRDLGIKIGQHRTGRLNAITDVPNVLVGHSTIIKGHPTANKNVIRSGVTAILPNGGDVFHHRAAGGCFILNGAGEVSGITQLTEWGLIETPILLTNTLSVGTCSEALVQYMTERYPDIGMEQDVIIPIVGECDDSWMNDIAGIHVKKEHVFEAIKNANDGPVAEGNVGGGTGMITCDFKGGIGTSSRRIDIEDEKYTVGVLVMSNFGHMADLRMDGTPVGRLLQNHFKNYEKRKVNYGSIIAVLATDAPLLPHQLSRIAKRMGLGVGRCGSIAAHGSGEIMLAFSTANTIPRNSKKMTYKMKILLDTALNPIYEAAIEATEESIFNAICMGEEMRGAHGNFCPALPLDHVKEIFRKRENFFQGLSENQ